jgi:hypothetical protein
LKFKLDENIGRRGLEFLKASGHDVMTVRDKGLQGVADQRPKATLHGILSRLQDFLTVLEAHSVVGALWIVEPGRVRIHLGIDAE